jgi:hypothetical protein
MKIKNIARWKKALLILVLFEVLFGVLVVLIGFRDDSFPLLDMRLAYNFDTFQRALDISNVRVYYLLFRALDIFFPLVYVWFFILISDKGPYVKIAIVFAAIFDYVENLMQTVYLFLEEHDVFQMILLISMTWMKFAWLGISIVLVMYYYVNLYVKNKQDME